MLCFIIIWSLNECLIFHLSVASFLFNLALVSRNACTGAGMHARGCGVGSVISVYRVLRLIPLVSGSEWQGTAGDLSWRQRSNGGSCPGHRPRGAPGGQLRLRGPTLDSYFKVHPWGWSTPLATPRSGLWPRPSLNPSPLYLLNFGKMCEHICAKDWIKSRRVLLNKKKFAG